MRHIDALEAAGVPIPAGAPAPAWCALCGCTDEEPCDSDEIDSTDTCHPVETSLDLRLCSYCVRTVAADAIEAGVYTPGALW